jgi:hypothetical protein
LTAGADVGPTQKSAANVGSDSSAAGVDATPDAVTMSPALPLSKQSRNFPPEHVSPARPQSLSTVQPRKVSTGLQKVSNGPLVQLRSFALGVPGSGAQSSGTSHWFGALATPGTTHAEPGHSLFALHAAPTLAPPEQRLPPQIGPIGPGGSGQSAFALHGVAAALLQVSH